MNATIDIETIEQYTPTPGESIRALVKLASFGGLFISLIGTLFIWAGTEAFNCSSFIWQLSIVFNVFCFALTWAAYLPFKNTNSLLGHGIISAFMLFSAFWLFGFSGFYFYYLFGPLNNLIRFGAITWLSAILLYRTYCTLKNILDLLKNNIDLLDTIYCKTEYSVTYEKKSFQLIHSACRNRSPFRSVHVYAAFILAPFILILNRLLTPLLGDGNGVFIIVSFFSAPLLAWGVEIFIQTVVTMIYYPIKLQRNTGKHVLIKD